jgi:ribose transport system ATP-binding protein
VDFDLYPGRVHALLGQNGAGKSTLISILSGVLQADSGEIVLSGESRNFSTPREALDAGIVAVYQELSLLPHMTVSENLFLGIEPGKLKFLDRKSMADQSAEMLRSLGAEGIDPNALVGTLSLTSQQIVEIAKALIRNAKVLILDEPSAVLGDDELELLYNLIAKLKATGIAIVYITHRLDEVMQIADEVTIMRDGRKVITTERANLDTESMIEALVGRKIATKSAPKWINQNRPANGDPILKVSNLILPGMTSEGLNFDLFPGEILGLVGMTGSGRSRLLRTLAGLAFPKSGQVSIAGKILRIRNPRTSISAGVVLVPEDRKRMGLVLDQPIGSNIVLSIVKMLARATWIPDGLINKRSNEMLQRLSVKSTGPNQIVRYLSGGNQQKVVIGRCLTTEPRLLLLDEPLRGVDIGAKSEIVEIVSEIAKKGTAVIVVSSEIDDILALTDRLFVMRDGEMIQELTGDQANEAEVLRASVGVSHE